MPLHLGRRLRDKKDHEVPKNPRVKVYHPRVKVHQAPWKKNRDQRVAWKKDRNDLRKQPAAMMNKVLGRKAANQAEDEKKKMKKKKTAMLSGNVWRTGCTSLTC